MTKRNQEIDVDAGAEFEALNVSVSLNDPIHPDEVGYVAAASYAIGSAYKRLIDSGIIVAAEGAISWREGHLEHVARVYAADQRLAWRDYADDLTVALSADGGTFAALVDKARGESE